MAALGDPVQPDVGEAAKPKFTVTEQEIKLPGLTIDRKTLEARIDAAVCLDSGILEYVVCRPNTFEHEAIFVTDTEPELVHAGLLLLGMKPTPLVRGLDEIWLDKALKQENSKVKIDVEWEVDGKMKRVSLASMLRNREVMEEGPAGVNPAQKKKDEAVKDAWVFTGSFMHEDKETGKRVYAGNVNGILVGIWPDPSTVIQYGIASGNPYEDAHEGLEINEETVPKLGTKVNLVFSRAVPFPEKNSMENSKAGEIEVKE